MTAGDSGSSAAAHGEAIRTTALAALERFVEHARDPAWLEETLGISMDIDLVVFQQRKRFRRQLLQRQGPAIVFELVWRGRGKSPRDVMRDFYRLVW